MPRPAKWKSPTTAIRVPGHLAELLLEIARSLDADAAPLQVEPDPEMEAYLSFVQNSTKPHLVSIRDSTEDFRERNYIVRADPVSFDDWKRLEQVSERLEKEVFAGLSEMERLYLFSLMVQEVFPEWEGADV